MLQGIAQLIQIQKLAVDLNFTRRLVQPHDSVGNSQLTLSCQTANTENLTFPDIQVNSFYLLTRHIYLVVAKTYSNLLVADLTGIRLRAFIYQLLYLTANHQLCNLNYIGIFNLFSCNELAISKNGHTVCHCHNLVQTVSNENNGNALG